MTSLIRKTVLRGLSKGIDSAYCLQYITNKLVKERDEL